MPNALEKLSDVSGIKKEKIQEIWNNVRENRDKLNSCKKHQFGEIDSKIPNQRVVCKNCGGVMHTHDILAYQDGYAAAGGNPEDICTFI